MPTTKVEFRTVSLDWLQPAGYNPRAMSEDSRARLERGITAFGLVDPFVARDDGLLLGGHQRLISAKRLGLTEGPCMIVHGLTDEEAAALNVLLNNPSAQGQWDMPKLTALLSELDGTGFDATLTGFSEQDLERLLATPGEPPSEQQEPGEQRPFGVLVICADAADQRAVFEQLTAEGHTCKEVVT